MVIGIAVMSSNLVAGAVLSILGLIPLVVGIAIGIWRWEKRTTKEVIKEGIREAKGLTETESVKYCPKCGAKMPDNAMYCPECGEKIR